ncbi:MAG: hypothetical protein GF417_02825 [Candidatus Latescibacteria bacterium]|nr:hypothetical protein [bacterium]MBD3423362.1 hypothetical protein [Candidatus Latescibacterota bacterium]
MTCYTQKSIFYSPMVVGKKYTPFALYTLPIRRPDPQRIRIIGITVIIPSMIKDPCPTTSSTILPLTLPRLSGVARWLLP